MASGRPTRRLPLSAGGVVVALGLVACADSDSASGRDQARPSVQSSSSSPAPADSAAPAEEAEQGVEGTVVRFTAGSVVVEAVIEEDSPTTRSFLAMLPMTLRFSDYGGQEKVSSPPDAFDYSGAEGMRPEAGDLFSYRPWGNLGFFYDAEGSTYSDDLVRIGTTDDIDQIEQLDGQDVTIAITQ